MPSRLTNAITATLLAISLVLVAFSAARAHDGPTDVKVLGEKGSN